MKTPNQLSIVAYLLVVMVLAAACKDGNNVTNNPPPDPQNRSPEEFSLVTVKDKARGVDLKPEFSWNAAEDPDGDKVTYTIYLNIEEENPKTVYASGLGATGYTPEMPLKLYREYYWKVVAEDGRSGQVSSPVFSFETRDINGDKKTTSSANFSKRGYAAAVTFKNKLWLIGGRGPDLTRYNDVWSSTDGKTWNMEVTSAAFPPRGGHTALVFKDKMWVIGGFYYNKQDKEARALGDVWYSTDGANWTQATNNAAFPPREDFTALAFDGKMYVLCGWNGKNMLKDIWMSTDGENWELSNNFTYGLNDHAFHASVVYGGKMFLVGGSDELEPSGTGCNVFRFSSSVNGWLCNLSTFGIRNYPAVAVYKEKVWVIGGKYKTEYYNDVWYFD